MNTARCTLLILFCSIGTVSGESDTRSVKSDFDRCTSAIERTQRELLRFETMLQNIEKDISKKGAAVSNDHRRELQQLMAKYEYLNNRIDRTTGQRDKISSDLKNLSGPVCPSCVSSSVDLYCRSSETIQNELDAFTGRASVLQDAIQGEDAPANKTDFISRRQKITRNIEQYGDSIETCSSAAGKLLWKQCRINLQRADSLHDAGKTEQSIKTLSLVELLVTRAVTKCSEE
jgi:chromosome segregation ATPase